MERRATPDPDPLSGDDTPGPRATSIAITSGKGGVGKTNISLNLSIALSAMGKRVLLVDADLGLANVDILLGLTPRFTLESALRGECAIFDVTVQGPEGLTIIPAASGIGESHAWRTGDMVTLQKDFSRLERGFDLILIDTGAGISSKVTDFVVAADQVTIVAVPEPTSIADAYAILKVSRGLKAGLRANLLVNRARSSREAYDIHTKFSQIVSRFLDASVGNMGFVLEDPSVEQGVRTQLPFVLGAPRSPAARCIEEISRSLGGAAPSPASARGLFQRILGKRLVGSE